ncbi:MAG: hypothetical protein ACPL6C_00965, partial [bacterium]
MKAKCLLVLITFGVSISLVPRVLNYQGKMLDSSGVGINDTLDITFRLYTSETGGEPIWEKTLNDIIVRQGIFSVELSGFPDSVDFSQEYWLEVSIGEERFLPRERLTSAPYSIRASTVERAVQSVRRRGSRISRTGTIILSELPGATIDEAGDSIFIFFGAGGGALNYSLSVEPPVDTVKAGFSRYPQVKLESMGCEAESVSLAIEGLPEGVSATFTPLSCLPPCNVTLHIATSESVTAGIYPLTIIANSISGLRKVAVYTLTITPPFNYAMRIDPSSATLDQGDTARAVVTASLITGFAENVAFSVSGLPTGAFGTFSPNSCLLSCGSNMTISTSTTTPIGNYNITI